MLRPWSRHRPGSVRLQQLPRPPQAVTFDCWNTLLVEEDWSLAHARRVEALRHAAEAAGRPTEAEEARDAFDAAWLWHMDEWVRGVATGAPEIARQALHRLGLAEVDGAPRSGREGPAAAALEELVHAWQEASHSGRVRAVEGACELLEALAARGVRRALVCDTGLTPGRVVRIHLEREGLLEHLETCVFSDEVGVPKPDPRTFAAALAALRSQSEDSVHVGDLRRTDVAGARAFGMVSIRLRAVHDDTGDLPDADVVADSHAEVGELLGVGQVRGARVP